MSGQASEFIEKAEDVDQAARRLDLQVRELIALGDAQRAVDCLHTAVGRTKTLAALLRRSFDRR